MWNILWWKNNETYKSLIIYSRVIPSTNALQVTTSLNDVANSCPEINFLEHVQVQLNLNYTIRGDLEINLTSPQGTTSRLIQRRRNDNFPQATYLTNWKVLTLHHWGENPSGIWELSLKNSRLDRNNTGYNFHCYFMLMLCYIVVDQCRSHKQACFFQTLVLPCEHLD